MTTAHSDSSDKRLNKQLEEEQLGDRIHNLCEELGIPTPLEFMVSIMAGRDPRPLSKGATHLLDLVDQVGDTAPNQRMWKRLKRCILAYNTVDTANIGLSAGAAKQLLEYSFAKKRAETVNVTFKKYEDVKPLTHSEVKLFNEKFNSEY